MTKSKAVILYNTSPFTTAIARSRKFGNVMKTYKTHIQVWVHVHVYMYMYTCTYAFGVHATILWHGKELVSNATVM